MRVIHTKGLTKSYRRFEKEEGLRGSFKSLFRRKYSIKTAVREFDLDVEEGEFLGLIGPNGAGKTTLIKMLTGIVAPTQGEIDVLGYYPNRLENALKRQYAVVMGQKSQLFFELTAADTFALFKELYAIPEIDFRRNVAYFTELFDIGKLLNVQVRTLSLGERMKMELIVALLHDPKVLFLDEPTIGLDAIAQKQIRGFLREINAAKGTTILLTSHYMEDIQRLCKRCVVMGEGEKLYDGALAPLFDRFQTHKRVTLTLENGDGYLPPPPATVVESAPGKLSFMVPKGQVQALLRDCMEACAPTDVAVEEEDVGSVVERIYAERGRLRA